MESSRAVSPGRLRRLAEELAEEHVDVFGTSDDADMLLDEIDYALRPPAHERRIPTYGAIVAPAADVAAWEGPTDLSVSIRATEERADDDARRYADGGASWVVRTEHGVTALAVFDRAASSERDMVVVAEASGGTLVQRDRRGDIRVVGSFGVVRWDGVRWQFEPPIGSWLKDASCGLDPQHTRLLEHMLRFAVHDLGATGVGALLVYRPTDGQWPTFERRLPTPPPLQIDRPTDLAPLYHVLTQVDGAAMFDACGTLRKLGVRLVPSAIAESEVVAYRGTRHTSARRYSYDDPGAVVVAVSEDGPVTLFRGGQVLGRSAPDRDTAGSAR